MKIKNHYWRENIFTDDILTCFNSPENCIGGEGDNLCNIGYKGALCEACDLENSNGNGSYANYGK